MLEFIKFFVSCILYALLCATGAHSKYLPEESQLANYGLISFLLFYLIFLSFWYLGHRLNWGRKWMLISVTCSIVGVILFYLVILKYQCSII